MISAVVLTKNEEKNIERYLNSLLWCDEIIIIDDYSEDKTVVSCQLSVVRKKIKIFQRKLDGDFAQQRNFGLEKAKGGEWVLFVDADEVISDELASEIKSQISNLKSQISGYYIKRKDCFLGRWLKHGETGNMKFIRLAKKDVGRWQGRIHEVWIVEGKVGELRNPIQHFPHVSVSDFLRDINSYTDLVAQCWKEEGRRTTGLEIVLYPVGKFIYNYILKLGFLDGMPGLIMALIMSFHSFLARSKYYLIKHNGKNS